MEEENDNDAQYSEAFIEDSRRSGFTFKALMHIENSLLLLVLLSIIISILDQDLAEHPESNPIHFALALQSIISCMLSKVVANNSRIDVTPI